jgi:NADPH:quinone reductase
MHIVMQAIRVHRFGGPEELRHEALPDPVPGPGQLLVRIEAAGVNPVDTYIRAGIYAWKPGLPYTPGSDAAGTVAAVGDGVTGFRPGDRVYLFGSASGRAAGAYASHALCGPQQAYRLPNGVSFAQGAALGVPYATAHRALVGRGRARAGETVLVHGASGGVGMAAVQIARSLGLTIIGTAGTAEGLALVRAQGAHHVVNHGEPGRVDRIRELTGGRGVDLILEMAAHINLDTDLALLGPRGRVVVIGNRGRIEIDARQAMAKDSAILGMSLWNVSPAELAAIHEALAGGLERGELVPVVGRELPLAEAARAHELVLAPGARGKIVLLT